MTITEPAQPRHSAVNALPAAAPTCRDFRSWHISRARACRSPATGYATVRVAIDAHLDIFAAVAAKHGISAAEAEEAYRFYTADRKRD